jgi:hypothetical protein
MPVKAKAIHFIQSLTFSKQLLKLANIILRESVIMKKAKILALVLVAALMLTGGAYAYWNQSISLVTTAAMGDMNVVVANPHVYPLSYMPGVVGRGWTTMGLPDDYMNSLTGSVSGDNSSVNVTVDKMYPGAKFGLDYQIQNNGDVPFSLKGVTVTCNNNSELFAHLTGAFQFAYVPANNLRGATRVVTVAATGLSAAGLSDAIETACSDIVVYPGDSLRGIASDLDDVTTFMQVSVDGTIAGSDYENQPVAFTVAFDWQQCTPTQVA